MRASAAVVFVLGGLLASVAAGADKVTVPGSKMEFDTEIVQTIENQPVKMRLTGVGLRERFIFDVNAYVLASYIPVDAEIKTAEELLAADIPKAIHVKVERDVKSKTIAEAFEKGILANYPGQFGPELTGFKNYFLNSKVKENDSVWFVHVPGKGLRCNIANENEMQIQSPEFAKAVWSIWLGPKFVTESIKKGLVERL